MTDNPCDARLVLAPNLTLNSPSVCLAQIPLKCATSSATPTPATFMCMQPKPCPVHP